MSNVLDVEQATTGLYVRYNSLKIFAAYIKNQKKDAVEQQMSSINNSACISQFVRNFSTIREKVSNNHVFVYL